MQLTPCTSTPVLLGVWLLLLLGVGWSTAAAQLQPGSVDQELQELRQLVASLVGAEPVHPVSAEQQFLPGTHNTQRLIARQPQLWPQHFTFLSAVAADSSVRCSHVMTDRARLTGGPLYQVLGDAAGRLYFFTAQGHLMHEHDTGVASSITSLSSDLVRHNETQLLVGQQDGTITLLSVSHEHSRLPDGSGIRSIHAVMVSTAADRAQQRNDTDVSSHQQPIRHVLFGKPTPRRTLLAVDAAGRVLLILPGSGHLLMMQHVTAGPPLAINTHSNFQVVLQTDTATAILLMKRGRSLVTKPCAGLAQDPAAGTQQPAGQVGSTSSSGSSSQGDRLVAAVFDPQRSFRVFGVTAAGDLLVLVVPSGAAAHTCRVVQRVPLGLPPGPVHLVMAKGRLVLLHSEGVAAFNLSAHKAQLPGSYLVSHTWQHLWRLYGLSQQHQQLQDQAAGAGAQAGSNGLQTSSNGNGAADGVLHSSAWDTPLMAAAAAPGLLLLPFGSKGMAVFATAPGLAAAAGGLAAAAAGGGGASSSGGDSSGGGGVEVNWVKLLQPFVVVMMIIVGVWQFVRASSRSSLAARRASGRYGAAALGMGMHDLDLLSRSTGLAGSFPLHGELTGAQRGRSLWAGEDEDGGLGGLGSFSSLDRDFGPYAGPRGRREHLEGPAAGGPLGALTARRRARAAMLGSRQGEREQQGLRQRGLGGGAGARRAGTVGEGARRGGVGLQGERRAGLRERIAEEEEAMSEGYTAQQQEGEQHTTRVDSAAAAVGSSEGVLQQQQQQQQLDSQQDESSGVVIEGDSDVLPAVQAPTRAAAVAGPGTAAGSSD